MKTWFLVLILSTGDPEILRSVLIEQPDETTCLRQLNSYVYSETNHAGDVVEHAVVDKACREHPNE